MAHQETTTVQAVNDKTVEIVSDPLIEGMGDRREAARAVDKAAMDADSIARTNDLNAKRAESLERGKNLIKP